MLFSIQCHRCLSGKRSCLPGCWRKGAVKRNHFKFGGLKQTTTYEEGKNGCISLICFLFSLGIIASPYYISFFFYHGTTAPSGPRPSHYRGFTITLTHITFGMTPLDEWSARRRDSYLTTHNTHKRKTSMPPTGFEPTIPASERPQTHVLDRAATGIGCYVYWFNQFERKGPDLWTRPRGKNVVRFPSKWLLVIFITVIGICVNSNERESWGCH
jgi:hypothetical protein